MERSKRLCSRGYDVQMPTRKKAVRRKKGSARIGGTDARRNQARVRRLLFCAPLTSQIEEDGGAVTRFLQRSIRRQAVAARGPSARSRRADALPARSLRRARQAAHGPSLEKIGSFLDPIIVVRHDDADRMLNGNHRLQALKKLGVPHDRRAAGARRRCRVQGPSRSTRRRRTTCARSRSRPSGWRARPRLFWADVYACPISGCACDCGVSQ